MVGLLSWKTLDLNLHTAALIETASYDVLNLAPEGPKNLLSEANSDDSVEMSVAGATPEQDRLTSDESSLISRQPGDLSATSRIPNNEWVDYLAAPDDMEVC